MTPQNCGKDRAPLNPDGRPGRSPLKLAVCGPSGSGKTTLICKLLSHWRLRGWRVAVVKHSHKKIELEPPGKDTRLFREAGAQAVALAAPGLISVIQPWEGDPPVAAVCAGLPAGLDLVVVEGYKGSELPKLVLVPEGMDLADFAWYRQVAAYISDRPLATDLPVFGRAEVAEIAAFIEAW